MVNIIENFKNEQMEHWIWEITGLQKQKPKTPEYEEEEEEFEEDLP